MEEFETISLTKSCYVHKPVKQQKKKKSGSKASLIPDTNDFSLWDEMASKIKLIEKKAYADIFEGIHNFVQDCSKSPDTEPKDIPAAVLVMGVNMSDHGHIFQFLESYLKLSDVHFTVILESKKCHNFTVLMQTIYNNLLDKFDQLFNFDDELPKKQECSFDKLYMCYQILVEKMSNKRRTPKKRQQNFDVSSMPIVLLIQDVENFNSDLLKKLVVICRLYSAKLPIVLIFGMSSAMVSLHNILPQEAYSCLEVETFHSVSATDFLTRVIDEVVISPSQPFKLGPKVFKLIIDTVLYHDFSISNLSYLLKFSIIEHLHENRLASLCCHESEISDRVNELSNEDLQVVRSLPSFRMYLENNPGLLSALNKPSGLKEFIVTHIKKLFEDQKVIMVLLKLLHCFVKDLPEYPLGKQLRELYSLSLEKEISVCPAYAAAERLLKMQSQNSLLQKLKAGLDILNEATSELWSDVIKSAQLAVENCIEKLSNLTTSDFDKKVQDPLSLQTEKITSRFQFQEMIQKSIKQKRSNYEALRNEIIEGLLSIFKYIRPPSSFPLNEIFYFDNVASLKQHLMAVPRVTACHALANPQHYFKCDCCKVSDPEETKASLPDISLLYKLHLDSGKLINLRDWLEAYKVTKNNAPKKRGKMKVKEKDDELNIRFLQAVSELQLLGFIKSTKRKTDHVARLTFGIF